MRFVLDVSACESVEDLHRALAEGLRFPAWYSGNLDALHDCLTDLHEPTELIVRGTSALDELLGRRANAFRRVLDDSAEENPNLTVRFEEAVQDSIKRTIPLHRRFGLAITSRELLQNGSKCSIFHTSDTVKP